MKSKSLYELPESEKIYEVIFSDNMSFIVNGEQKEKILKTKDQFIITPRGEVYNRSFIRAIILEKDKTRKNAEVKGLLEPSLSDLVKNKDELVFDDKKKVYVQT